MVLGPQLRQPRPSTVYKWQSAATSRGGTANVSAMTCEPDEIGEQRIRPSRLVNQFGHRTIYHKAVTLLADGKGGRELRVSGRFTRMNALGAGLLFRHRLGKTPLSAGCLASAVLVLSAHAAFAAKQPSMRVSADYEVRFLGSKIGTFNFKSNVEGRKYTLTSSSWVKVFFGAFKWNSQSTSQGVLGKQARPKSFNFNYQIKKKRKRAELRFARGNVVGLKNTPPVHYSGKYVPIKPKHLVGVVDPMTAIMQMTQARKGDPCRHSAEIFDGKRRLRLRLAPKGRVRIRDRQASGQPAFGYVCQIRYTPIAGHKISNNVNHLARLKDMEIVLRPVPSANLLVPYQINIPTLMGSVSISAKSIIVDNGNNPRIAMRP